MQTGVVYVQILLFVKRVIKHKQVIKQNSSVCYLIQVTSVTTCNVTEFANHTRRDKVNKM